MCQGPCNGNPVSCKPVNAVPGYMFATLKTVDGNFVSPPLPQTTHGRFLDTAPSSTSSSLLPPPPGSMLDCCVMILIALMSLASPRLQHCTLGGEGGNVAPTGRTRIVCRFDLGYPNGRIQKKLNPACGGESMFAPLGYRIGRNRSHFATTGGTIMEPNTAALSSRAR